MNQTETISIETDDLIPRLTAEFGYKPEHARRVAQRLITADDGLKRAFWRWWRTGDIDNSVEFAGYTPARLMAERKMTPLSAYSTLDLLQREPAETLRALEKGHDTVIPRKRPALTETP
jgi:hypothetical protein